MNIEATEIGKFFPNGTEALKSVSLEMSSGVLGMIGPNGAGKTTLLRILATLLEPSSGSVKLFGMDSPQMDRAICRRIGYVPQQIHLVDVADLVGHQDLAVLHDAHPVREVVDVLDAVGDEEDGHALRSHCVQDADHLGQVG